MKHQMKHESTTRLSQSDISAIVAAERGVLESLHGFEATERTYTCSLCGGTAHLVLHEWLGYTSYCEKGCFTS